MEPVSGFFKQSIPHYFENLPIPNTFGGWFRLSFKDWLSLVPLGAAVGGIGYMSYLAFCPKGRSTKINPDLHKENAKHVDVLDVENLGEKTAICRCWRSKKLAVDLSRKTVKIPIAKGRNWNSFVGKVEEEEEEKEEEIDDK